MTIGFRIAPVTQRVDPALIARAAKLPAANIGDVMSRMQTMRGGFRPFGGKKVIAGPAFTVRARSGDNLLLHRACDMAEPGDIIVGDGGGDLAIALMGELMIGHAQTRGVQGIVLDGAVRDVDALAAMDIGVWANQFHVPAHPGAAPHPRIPDLTQIRLIDYDFAKYGDPEVRRRILARWDREIGSLPR